MNRSHLICLSIALCALSSVACSDDNNDGPDIIVPPPKKDVTKDTPVDTKDETDDEDEGDDLTDTDPDATANTCTNVIDLGTVDASAGTLTLTGDTTGASLSGIDSSCGKSGAVEQVFAMKFAKPTRFLANLGDNPSSVRWSFSLRQGSCEESTEIRCVPNTANFFFNAEADETYYFVVEPLNDTSKGTFTIDVRLTELVCLPIGSRTCAADNGVDGINFCTGGGGREEFFACPATPGGACSSAQNACGGDGCENLIELPVVAGTTYSLESAYESYTDKFNFADAVGCVSPDNNGEANYQANTDGNDVAFRLTGMLAGQKLSVDASTELGDVGDSALFIMTGCDVSTCLYGVDLSDKIEQWEVPADGDYVVVVDRFGGNDSDIALKIDVE